MGKSFHSDVLYTQMKGRGCRVIDDDRLREVTPNANTKGCYYIVDVESKSKTDGSLPVAQRILLADGQDSYKP